MPKAIFINPDETSCKIEIPAGMSLMQAAVNEGLEGIAGDCGGSLGCATCHMFISEPFFSALPAATSVENDMLDCTATKRETNSRLSCQVKMADMLDGIMVRIPQTQY